MAPPGAWPRTAAAPPWGAASRCARRVLSRAPAPRLSPPVHRCRSRRSAPGRCRRFAAFCPGAHRAPGPGNARCACRRQSRSSRHSPFPGCACCALASAASPRPGGCGTQRRARPSPPPGRGPGAERTGHASPWSGSHRPAPPLWAGAACAAHGAAAPARHPCSGPGAGSGADGWRRARDGPAGGASAWRAGGV